MKYRVEVLSTSNAKITKGDLGELVTIRFEAGLRIVEVKLDSGSNASLVEGQDRWRVYEEE